MINLIGSELNYDWLKLPLVHLHWYDKAVRPGRKVGHLNLTDSDTSRLSATTKRSLRSCRANTPAALSGRKVSLNKQRGRRILCRRPSRSQTDAGSALPAGIVNTRQCANPCRLSAPLHISAYRGHLRSHRAIGFGKRRQLIGRSLTNSALLWRSQCSYTASASVKMIRPSAAICSASNAAAGLYLSPPRPLRPRRQQVPRHRRCKSPHGPLLAITQ